MKFSLFALPALMAGAFAAPAPLTEKRQTELVTTLVTDLFGQVIKITANISTCGRIQLTQKLHQFIHR
jgi:hypothetical protein